MKQDLPEVVKKVAREIKKDFPDSRILIVGGFVRDRLLGEVSKDIDLEVFGVFPEDLLEILKKIFGPENINEVGKSFGVIKVRTDEGGELDVSVPRVDSKTASGGGHRGIEASGEPNLSIIEAQRRRDFTINAMGLDILTGEIVDSFGGAEDLKDKILRLVDENTFKDDPLRVLRGVQFVARFDLAVDPKTFTFMKDMVEAGALDQLPADRIRDEIEKLLTKSDQPSVGLELMCELGIIERHFPELEALTDCEQNPKHHPEGDVWTHTKMVVDKTAELLGDRFPKPEEMSPAEYREIKFVIMLAALLHDVGKPIAFSRNEDGEIHTSGHGPAGLPAAKRVLDYLNTSNSVCHQVLKIVEFHRLPDQQIKALERGELTRENYVKATRRLLTKIKPVPWRVFLLVCEADRRGRGLELGEYKVLSDFEQMIRSGEVELGDLVTGQDVLGAWKELKGDEREGGPWVGEILATIEDEGWSTREKALGRLREIVGKMK